MSRRSEQLKTIVNNFIAIHDEWVADDNREHPDEDYWDSAQLVVDAVEDAGDIPGDARILFKSMESFADEVDKVFASEDDSQPHEGFWQAVVAIRSAIEGPKRRELKPLESIKELCAMPYMQHAQVAAMYGFKDAKGNLLVHLVQKELDSPGSVIATKGGMDGRDWKDPRLAELDVQDTAVERAAEAIEKKGRRARKEDKPCRETSRELWEQNVGVEQAAQMLKQSEATVRKQFDEWTAAADLNRKVWDLVDKAVPVDKIAKQLKVDLPRVESAIRDRPAVGAGEGTALPC